MDPSTIKRKERGKKDLKRKITYLLMYDASKSHEKITPRSRVTKRTKDTKVIGTPCNKHTLSSETLELKVITKVIFTVRVKDEEWRPKARLPWHRTVVYGTDLTLKIHSHFLIDVMYWTLFDGIRGLGGIPACTYSPIHWPL